MILIRLKILRSLIDLGCKNILYSSVDNLSVGKLRTDGYLALANNNISVDQNIVLRTDSEELSNLLQKIPKDQLIDAIFALEESNTVAALKFGLKMDKNS
jgi:LacI family transcriptional regulator